MSIAEKVLAEAKKRQEAQKKSAGMDLTRNAMGIQNPAPTPQPMSVANRAVSASITKNALKDYKAPKTNNDKAFTDAIIQRSIFKNRNTGGRHPDAAPVQRQQENNPPVETPTPSPVSRDVERGGAKGTQTSPTGRASAADPTDWAAYEKWLTSKYGISYQNNRSGYQSNDLPNDVDTSDAKVMGYGDLEAKRLAQGQAVEGVIDSNGYTSAKARLNDSAKPTGAQDPQNSAIDKGDQSRAIQDFGVGVNGADFSNDYGDDQLGMQGSAISKRSQAFLNAPMSAGPAEIMRRTNYSQGILEKDGKYAVKDGNGGYTEITREGYDDIRDNKRDQQQFSQDYLKNYLSPVVNSAKGEPVGAPKESENPDVSNPQPNSYMGPLKNDADYGEMLDATAGMKGMGPVASQPVYDSFLRGREPMMRDTETMGAPDGFYKDDDGRFQVNPT